MNPREELCTFLYGYYFLDMHIAAAIRVRDIIYSRCMCVKGWSACFNVRKVFETRQQIHIFSNSVSNTVDKGERERGRKRRRGGDGGGGGGGGVCVLSLIHI